MQGISSRRIRVSDTDLIIRTFHSLDQKFEFMVLRSFHLIPDHCSVKDDIDLLIRRADYDSVAKYMERLGYNVHFDCGHYLDGAVGHIHCMNKSADVHFDIVAGLYYRSLTDPGTFVGGFTDLEESIWANKASVPEECWKYRPGFEDHLTHICCHSIFDTRGVPEKYIEIINELYASSHRDMLSELFKAAFHHAGPMLLELIHSGDCAKMYDEYVAFKEY